MANYASLHAAYETLSLKNFGYGLFVAGPSRTADIEQSLVIGAHGAITMEILLVMENYE